MPETILHNYQLSPYSEKIRLALGLKGVSWRSVEIPVWTPRPKLTPMTGGYRRTPILQLGAEFYCDTLLILRVIEELGSSRSLYPARQEGTVKALCWWIEKSSFMNAVCLTIGNMAGKLPQELIDERRVALFAGVPTMYAALLHHRDRAAYDVAAFWARAGLAHLLTRPGETPPFQRGGMGDHTAGMTLAAAICAALVARTRTGKGQLVSTSLYRQGAYTVSFDLNTFLMTGHSIAIGQRETMGNPCMNNYTAGDGRRFWIVGLQGDRHWPALCRAVRRPEWLTDARFATGRSRAANAVELINELDEIFAARPLDEWAKVFAGEPDFFWSPINSVEDVVADEQFHAAGGVVYVPRDASSVAMVATPADFHGTPWEPRSAAPGLGEHTDDILAELKTRRSS